MKITLSINYFPIILLFCLNCKGQNINYSSSENTITSEDLKILIGEWTGTLTYIDYSSNKPYKMRANLIVKQGKKPNLLTLFNVYPKEPKANSKDKIKISKNGSRLNKKPVLNKQNLPNGQIKITTEYSGKDNKKQVFNTDRLFIGK